MKEDDKYVDVKFIPLRNKSIRKTFNEIAEEYKDKMKWAPPREFATFIEGSPRRPAVLLIEEMKDESNEMDD